jgi:hypothetical protein
MRVGMSKAVRRGISQLDSDARRAVETREAPPGSTPEFELAQDIVADWLGPDGCAWIGHLGDRRSRDLINAIAAKLKPAADT